MLPLLRLARIELAVDPVAHRGDEGGHREVRVDRRVHRAVLEPAGRRDAQRSRPVLVTPVGEDGCPEAGVPQAAVGVHGRGGHGGERTEVLEDAADGVQADLTRLLAVVGVRVEGVLVAAPEGDVVVAAVRRDAHERLRHEAREGVELAPHLLADLAERREVVGGLLGAVEAEVELDLAGRVLVVALDHVQLHLLAVLDHLVDDRLELGELVDVVAVRLCLALDRGRTALVQLQPHHLGLGAGAEMEAGVFLEVGLDLLQVRAAVGGEEGARVLALLAVAEAGHPDARDAVVPRERHERLRLGDADELRGLGAVADVVAVPVGEEVRRRAVDELEALAGDRLPVGSRHALAHDAAGDRGELVVDVRDPQLVDLLADLGDLLVATLGADEGFEIGRHALLLLLDVRPTAAGAGRAILLTAGPRL